LSLEDAYRLVTGYMAHYNTERLHSAIAYVIAYVTPLAKLEGRDMAIFAERDRKLELANAQHQRWRVAPSAACCC